MTVPQPAFSLQRRPALDGVRAIAVVLVVIQHSGELLVAETPSFAGGPYLAGGFLGVDLFFVLSGFLITGLLVEAWDEVGTLRLPTFYLRRALRLLPALVAVLAGTTAYAIWTDRDLGHHLRGVAAAGAYVWNWAVAFGADLGDFGHGHLWSLAIEEQFYLVWPTLLAVGLLVAPRFRAAPVLLCVAGLVATIFARHLLLDRGALADAYVRTDTRLDGLMVGAGALLAIRAGWRPPPRLRALTPVALAGIVGLATVASLPDRWLYSWGFTLVAVLAGLVVVGAYEGSPLDRVLSWRTARWLGARSYVLYLVHYPVFQATGEQLDGVGTPWRLAVGLALTAAATLACHAWVEMPVLRWRDRRWPRPARQIVSDAPDAAHDPATPTT